MSDRILLVGASSPVGRAVGDELVRGGHHLVKTSRSGSDEFETLDATDLVQAAQVLDRVNPRTVVYLARPELGTAPSDTVDAVAQTLREFAIRCAERGVERLVFASSAAAYGTSRSRPLRETDPPDPASPYARLKLRSEKVLAEVSASLGLASTSLRLFNVYGQGFSKSLVNRLGLRDESPVEVFDTGDFVRDYVHVADVARAFGAAVELADPGPTVFNVGTGVGTSNHALLALLPASSIRRVAFAGPPSVSIADTSRAHELLGFDASVKLQEALDDPRFFLS